MAKNITAESLALLVPVSETNLTDEDSPLFLSDLNKHVVQWLKSTSVKQIAASIIANLSVPDIDKLVEQLKSKQLSQSSKKNPHKKHIKNKQYKFTATHTISTIGPAFIIYDPLVVILGIGKYNGLPDLPGVTKDYQNVINTFVNCWKYKVFYQLNDNTNMYTNEINEVKCSNNYKLQWNIDEIEAFVENARKRIVKNKHDGLVFVLSSHGDTEKVIYDSECETCELESLFMMFLPGASALLESYTETKQETNSLFQIPKIFVLDHCRGDNKAKITNMNVNMNDTNEMTDNKSDEKDTTRSAVQHVISSKGKNNANKIKAETFRLKTVTKEQATTLAAQMTNFSKLYANTEGFSVADGSVKGGLFIRNVCAVFSDRNFVLKHLWNDIIIKIREYTKRDATIIGQLFNFTQLVENEGTFEKRVKFGIKKQYHVHKKQNRRKILSLSTQSMKVLIPNSKCGKNNSIVSNTSLAASAHSDHIERTFNAYSSNNATATSIVNV